MARMETDGLGSGIRKRRETRGFPWAVSGQKVKVERVNEARRAKPGIHLRTHSLIHSFLCQTRMTWVFEI